MFGYCPLASGSKGNSIYLGSKNTKVLIDAGISTKMLQKRLAEIDVTLDMIDAIIVTHEHMDHIHALKVLTNRYQIPILANADTAKGIYASLRTLPKFKIFTTGEPFEFGDLHITPFSVQHDTLDPVAFRIRVEDLTLGFCTDLGYVTSLVEAHLQNCDYLYLEANHQPSMVHSSPRSYIYKNRVLGRQGHLSNEACAELISKVFHEGLKHVHLAHLSGECNTPELALKVIQDHLLSKKKEVPLSVAFQDRVSNSILFKNNSTVINKQ